VQKMADMAIRLAQRERVPVDPRAGAFLVGRREQG